jgi:hypothetical protein
VLKGKLLYSYIFVMLLMLFLYSKQPGFGLHKDKESELGAISDISVCALTVFTNPDLDKKWFMECCLDESNQSVELQLQDGMFAFQPISAQKYASHRSYGPSLCMPRCVIIFRKVLKDVYKRNNMLSLNSRYETSNTKWYTLQELQTDISGMV